MFNHLLLRAFRAPRVAHTVSPESLGISSTEVWLKSPGTADRFAWFCAPAGEGPHPAVVVMHGWGANASLMLPIVPVLMKLGIGVLLVDARGHGRSESEPFASLPKFAEDIDLGLAWLAGRPEVDQGRIGVMGHSVGAGAALLVASRRTDLRCVVSLSAFAHPGETMTRFMRTQSRLFVPWIPAILRRVQAIIGYSFDAIAPIHTITRIRCPILLVHGVHDADVPIEDADRLFAVAKTAPCAIIRVSGGHDMRPHLNELAEPVTEFLTSTVLNKSSEGDCREHIQSLGFD